MPTAGAPASAFSVVQGTVNMKCPNCGAANLVHNTRDRPYTYKGELTVISAVAGDYCPNCGEAVIGLAEAVRTAEFMRAFTRQVGRGLLDKGTLT